MKKIDELKTDIPIDVVPVKEKIQFASLPYLERKRIIEELEQGTAEMLLKLKNIKKNENK